MAQTASKSPAPITPAPKPASKSETLMFTRSTRPLKGYAYYKNPGVVGGIYTRDGLFAGTSPDTITFTGIFQHCEPSVPAKKLTAEEKAANAAARKAMTPAQKAAEAQSKADKAAKRAMALAAVAARLAK